MPNAIVTGSGEQMGGIVTELHQIPDKYGGGYGIITGDDGRCYAWHAGNVFRDFTRMAIGQRVTFTIVAWSYANDITSKGFRD